MDQKKKKKYRLPKIRSYVRPTRVHTPKPLRENKHPKRTHEEEERGDA